MHSVVLCPNSTSANNKRCEHPFPFCFWFCQVICRVAICILRFPPGIEPESSKWRCPAIGQRSRAVHNHSPGIRENVGSESDPQLVTQGPGTFADPMRGALPGDPRSPETRKKGELAPSPRDFLWETRAAEAPGALSAVLGRSPCGRRARSPACNPPSLDPRSPETGQQPNWRPDPAVFCGNLGHQCPPTPTQPPSP